MAGHAASHAASSGTGSGIGLARGAIGLREVLFQSVTSMAPAGAVALVEALIGPRRWW